MGNSLKKSDKPSINNSNNVNNNIIVKNDNKPIIRKLNSKPKSLNTFEKNLKFKSENNDHYKLGSEPDTVDTFEMKLKQKTDNEENNKPKIKKNKKRQISQQEIPNNFVVSQSDAVKDDKPERAFDFESIITTNNENDCKQSITIPIADDNQSNDEEKINSPMPFQIATLINSELDDFNEFKLKIRNDRTLDKQTKLLMIISRKDTLINKAQIKQKMLDRSKLIVDLKVRLLNSTRLLNQPNLLNLNLNLEWINDILLKIDDWTNLKIDVIQLDSESLFKIYEIIDSSETCENFVKSKTKNIFEPFDIIDYLTYSDNANLIKQQIILEQEQLLQKQKEENEERERKNELIHTRKLTVEKLIFNLNKIGSYDNNIKELHNNINESVENYIQTNTNYIELDLNNYTKIIEFIKSIRISQDEKDNFEKLFIII